MSKTENFIERIAQFRDAKGLSNAKMSKAVGIDARTFNYYFEGRRTPAYALEKILLAYPELSAEWLLRGTGSMMLDENERASYEALSERIQTLEENNAALRLAIEALSNKVGR